MSDGNITRWVFASLAKYVKGVATGLGLPAVVFGVEEPNDNYGKATDRVEIRITGLSTREPTAGYTQVSVDCTVVLHSMLGDTKNRYQVMTYEAAFAEALDMDIAVYKYGVFSGDDDSFVGCLIPMTGKNEGVRILQFGSLPNVRATQSAVGVRYRLEVQE